MRYIDVRINQPQSERNAMHDFVVEHEAYERSRLLYRAATNGAQAALFHVTGPREPFESVLMDREGVSEAAVAPASDGTCYCYVRESMTATDRNFAEAFEQPGLLVLPPIEYRGDGTVEVSAVGPADIVGAAVRAIPDAMGIEVQSVGPYRAGRFDPHLELTPRQYEAVGAAVELGYYATPREADLEAVADRLGCGTGTAGELLRKAERTVMRDIVGSGPSYHRS